MKPTRAWLAALLLSATTAYAEQAPQKPDEVPAHAWLELQRSGQAASSQPQPLSGPAMDRVHQRYLKGFEHPQPMYYKHDESVSRQQ